jgi:hypothetical protein
MTNIKLLLIAIGITYIIYPIYVKLHNKRRAFYEELWRKTDEE